MGLAAALLGEVLIPGAIELRGGRLMIREALPPSELLAQRVYAEVLADARRSPRIWLETLTHTAESWVAERLHHDGQLRRPRQRRLSFAVAGGHRVHRPRDPQTAAAIRDRLSGNLERESPIPVSDAFLISLAHSTGLHLVLWEAPSTSALGRAEQLRSELPEALGLLANLCEAGIGADSGVPR